MSSPALRTPHTFEVEEYWRRRIGLPFAVWVGDGKRTLEMALRAIGYAEWCDEHPLFPAWVRGTRGAEAVVACGGTAVYSPAAPVAGVVVVHRDIGEPDMPALVRDCIVEGRWLVEDCTGCGDDLRGRYGNASVWDMGSYGIIVTADKALAERARALVGSWP